jgi:two-component system nitrogen regulation response regulator NtrX
MEQSARAHSTTPRKFSSEALSILNAYHWPGDVLQLKNTVDWILTNSIAEDTGNENISTAELPREIIEGKGNSSAGGPQCISVLSGLSIRDAREAFEREYFIEQLKRFSGNISQTAKFVGMERSALHRKLKSLNIVDKQIFRDQEE